MKTVETDPKKALLPLCGMCFCASNMVWAFFWFTFAPPDQYPTKLFWDIPNPLNQSYYDFDNQTTFGFECYTRVDGSTSQWGNYFPFTDTWDTNFFIKVSAINDDEVTESWPEAPLPSPYEVNVSHAFKLYFLYGFYLSLLTLAATFLGCCTVACKHAVVLKGVFVCLYFVQVVGGLIWFIYGQVVRFGVPGSICSGDRMIPEGPYNITANFTDKSVLIKDSVPWQDIPGTLNYSGNFIKSFTIIVYVFLSIFCLLFCTQVALK